MIRDDLTPALLGRRVRWQTHGAGHSYKREGEIVQVRTWARDPNGLCHAGPVPTRHWAPLANLDATALARVKAASGRGGGLRAYDYPGDIVVEVDLDGFAGGKRRYYSPHITAVTLLPEEPAA